MLPDTTTTAQAVEAFRHYFTVSRNKSPRTAVEYTRDLQRFARFIQPSGTELPDATSDQIEAWRDALLTDGRNQPQSVRRKLAAVSSFFKWRKKKKLMTGDNPFESVEMPDVGKRLPKVMSESEVQCLLGATVKHRRCNAYLQVRDHALLELLYGSGLRRFEACNLDIADIDLSNHRVRVRHGKGNKERFSYLSEPTVEALRTYLAVRPEKIGRKSGAALFLTIRGMRITPRQLWCVFKQFREAAKEQGLTKHVVPHTLRHSFASHIYRNSRNIMAVQKLLGHSNINTTQRYVHVEDDELREIYEASHPRSRMG